jgi:hypothetical protein
MKQKEYDALIELITCIVEERIAVSSVDKDSFHEKISLTEAKKVFVQMMEVEPEEKPKEFLIGQRVILQDREIGTIVEAENKNAPNNKNNLWVFSKIKNYASRYAIHNIKALPDGQL